MTITLTHTYTHSHLCNYQSVFGMKMFIRTVRTSNSKERRQCESRVSSAFVQIVQRNSFIQFQTVCNIIILFALARFKFLFHSFCISNSESERFGWLGYFVTIWNFYLFERCWTNDVKIANLSYFQNCDEVSNASDYLITNNKIASLIEFQTFFFCSENIAFFKKINHEIYFYRYGTGKKQFQIGDILWVSLML